MNANRNLSKTFFTLIFSFCIGGSYAQSCKKAFWSASEQYKSGRFESAQNLLNTCINSLNSKSNPDQLYKVYKLYISSCIRNKDKSCANTKRKKLVSFFPGKEEEVLKRLNQTKI
jgi:hypothetical protein